jgi:hypothetical protein
MPASDSERTTCPRCGSHVALLIETRLYCAICGCRVTILDRDGADQAKPEPGAGVANGPSRLW